MSKPFNEIEYPIFVSSNEAAKLLNISPQKFLGKLKCKEIVPDGKCQRGYLFKRSKLPIATV